MDEINFYIREEEYGWLSNFERVPQTIDGVTYPTNEHYYQSQKPSDIDMGRWIARAPTAYAAMMAGRSLRKHEIWDEWNDVKVEIMLIGLKAKFTQNDGLRERLLATGDAVIHEDSPTDMFWGKKGKDMLGKLLVQVREELKSAQI